MSDKWDEMIERFAKATVERTHNILNNIFFEYPNEYGAARHALRLAIAAIEAERDALKEAGRWIPVEERLPEIHDSVLIFDGCTIEIGHNEAVNTPCFFEDKENSFRQNTTYWQPLPQPPQS
jgi:hypothetical protein